MGAFDEDFDILRNKQILQVWVRHIYIPAQEPQISCLRHTYRRTYMHGQKSQIQTIHTRRGFGAQTYIHTRLEPSSAPGRPALTIQTTSWLNVRFWILLIRILTSSETSRFCRFEPDIYRYLLRSLRHTYLQSMRSTGSACMNSSDSQLERYLLMRRANSEYVY